MQFYWICWFRSSKLDSTYSGVCYFSQDWRKISSPWWSEFLACVEYLLHCPQPRWGRHWGFAFKSVKNSWRAYSPIHGFCGWFRLCWLSLVGKFFDACPSNKRKSCQFHQNYVMTLTFRVNWNRMKYRHISCNKCLWKSPLVSCAPTKIRQGTLTLPSLCMQNSQFFF